MKRKYFSALLMGALTIASVSTFTSCKDYDDDIDNLQSQIDKAGLQSDIDALKTQLQEAASTASAAKATAESALTKANDAAVKADVEKAIKAVEDAANKAANDVATAIDNAANAQTAADGAQKAADAAAKAAKDAQDQADKAVEDAADAVSKANAAAKQEDFVKALERIGNLETSRVTADKLDEKLNQLKEELLGADGDKETIGSLTVKVNAYKGAVDELYSAVTSVELVASYAGQSGANNLLVPNSALVVNMLHGLIAEDSKFGDETKNEVDPIIEYKKGQDVKDDASIVIRVNPVNADLTKGAKIVLLNSKGENLENIVKVGTPEKFNDYIVSRAASVNTGLWKLPISVTEGVSKEDFEKAVQTEDGSRILYAVAVNNTTTSEATSAADRYVVSSYDVEPVYKDFEADNDFTFKVDGTSIKEIHNRWNGTKIVSEKTTDSKDNPEYAWKKDAATAPVVDNADQTKTNVKKADTDVRSGEALLQVEVDKPFTISDLAVANDNKKGAADYYYVVLDKENAIESGVSELNAWNSYVIDGLCKNVKAGEKLSLTIKSQAANGDIIGFRVYAVNRDGKLLDPDGKAFYVIVGKAIGGIISGNIDPFKKVTETKEFKPVAGVTYGEWTIDTEASKAALPLAGKTPKFTAVYYKKINGKLEKINFTESETEKVPSDAEYVAFVVDHPEYIADNESVILVNQMTGGSGVDGYKAGTVTAKWTKVMPTAFPADIEFRPKQEITDGSGKFKAFLKPEYGWNTSNTSGYGTVDLNNVFYNLDNNVEFTIADARKNNNKIENLTVVGTTDDNNANHHNTVIAAEFIDSKTEHKVTAKYNYGIISCRKNDKGVYESQNWTIDYKKDMSVIFACWESVNTYDWAKATTNQTIAGVAYAKDAKLQPKLTWKANPQDVKGYNTSFMKVSNSYNNDFFGGTVSSLINDKLFKYVENSAHLSYGKQIDPYFTVSIDTDGNITFSQKDVQVENAPVADHDEVLSFDVTDAYGHTITIKSLTVKILRPASSAKRK
jgi:hypothetical protein